MSFYARTEVKAFDLENGNTLISGNDNLSIVTGYVETSSTMPGFMVVETEHGTLYLEAEETVTIVDEGDDSVE